MKKIIVGFCVSCSLLMLFVFFSDIYKANENEGVGILYEPEVQSDTVVISIKELQ